MIKTMENQYLKIEISSKGAELQSIFQKQMGKEILWQGDKEFWDRRSPILFPNVGRHYENFYLYKGKRYDTVQHGFARDMEFTCIEEKEDTLVFHLQDTRETREYFPYAFCLEITYVLKENTLEVSWKVKNLNEETMYFTIGGHPGFYVPILEDTVQTDYKLLFRGQEHLKYHLVHGMEGTADKEKTYTLSLEPMGGFQGCGITEHMFDRDALIFDDSQIDWVAIGYPDGTPYVAMKCEGFTNFGIWSLPHAPYICLEPWMGRCDDYGFSGEISEKPDIIALNEKDTFSHSYEITVYARE